MRLRKYTLEELINAVETTKSVRQALIALNVKPYGGNYDVFTKAVKHFNISIEHFDPVGCTTKSNVGRIRSIPLDEILVNDSDYQSSKLRPRLIAEGIFPHQCSNCKRSEWLNDPIPLELDHIDGNNRNNLLSNLRLLCPNCHALTPTYRGKNKKK